MTRSLQRTVLAVSFGLVFSSGCIPEAGAIPVVVANSFGAGNTYLTTVGWGVEGTASAARYRGQAEWFVPGTSGTLSTIQLAMFRSGGSGRSNFYITQDNGGIPGTILESYLNVLSPGGLLTLNSLAQPLLQSGLEYWICAEPADGTTVSGWYENNQGQANGFAFERSEWGWSAIGSPAPPSGVFRVTVNSVPEQTSSALLLLLATGCGWIIRRRWCWN